ncbi:hypothetical protein [Cupriavidus sp. H18C1]|uniref:hypothetical protein n=1 Tax=Cupriavidus sp. H18C1 TaxID=3241601 RepID=UPI003BB95E85
MEKQNGKRDLQETLIEHVRQQISANRRCRRGLPPEGGDGVSGASGAAIRLVCSRSSNLFTAKQHQRNTATNQQANQQFHDKRSFKVKARGSATLWQRVSA